MLSLVAVVICQTGSTSRLTATYKGSNCQYRYSSYDPYREGCKTCKSGYYIYRVARRLLTQKERFLQTSGKQRYTCYKCPSGCKTCYYNTSIRKVACNSCWSTDYYPIKTGIYVFSCGKCQPGCFTCSNPNTCNLASGCKKGYYKDSSKSLCPACKKNCAECTSATLCKSCKDGYFVKSNNCYPCSEGCRKCLDSSNCSTCYSSYDLKNGICVSKPFYRQFWFWAVILILLLIGACVACHIVHRIKEAAFRSQNNMMNQQY